jgi:hypothetical protein
MKAFPVVDVLNAISEIKNPCNHHPSPTVELTTSSKAALAECKSGDNVCSQCAYFREEEKMYLIQRLLTSVVERKFDLWNSFADKVKKPPISNDAYVWAVTAFIYRSDLIKFCRSEKILITIENEGERAIEQKDSQATQEQMLDSQDVLKNSQSQKMRGRLANAGQLAEAFKVKDERDKNLEWFKNNCTNYKRNKAFEDALAIPGKPGAGNANLFDVLVLLGYLESNQKRQTNSGYFKPPNYRLYLRTQVRKFFPELRDEFDDRFGTGDID